METKPEEQYFLYSSPITLLEELFFQFDWTYERSSDHEIMAEVEGRWCSYRLLAMWKQDLECLVISVFIDVKIPQDKACDIAILLGAINPKVWLGHFEVSQEENMPSYRYNLVLRGNPNATLDQIEEILATSVTECDRLYPALQFVLWGGKKPEEALMVAMLDTYGEA